MSSQMENKQYILITGAGGFIADVFEPPCPDASRVVTSKADLTQSSAVDSLLCSQTWSACYLLHGIMSGGAEANFDLGLIVNVDSHRLILDYLRRNQPGVIVVFPSSLTVYGPPDPSSSFISERTIPIPQSSYGAEKLIVETLINDYSCRGLIDGRICRLPTVIVRPGAPSAVASSFASGIVREPLKGESSVVPVSMDLEMWVCSPKTVVRNLVAIKDVSAENFSSNHGRTVNLPGQTVKGGQILDALMEVGGREALALVEEKRDLKVEAIVASWPARFDIALAESLGMSRDISLTEEVERFAKSLKG